jgi:hypothetical protein
LLSPAFALLAHQMEEPGGACGGIGSERDGGGGRCAKDVDMVRRVPCAACALRAANMRHERF